MRHRPARAADLGSPLRLAAEQSSPRCSSRERDRCRRCSPPRSDRATRARATPSPPRHRPAAARSSPSVFRAWPSASGAPTSIAIAIASSHNAPTPVEAVEEHQHLAVARQHPGARGRRRIGGHDRDGGARTPSGPPPTARRATGSDPSASRITAGRTGPVTRSIVRDDLTLQRDLAVDASPASRRPAAVRAISSAWSPPDTATGSATSGHSSRAFSYWPFAASNANASSAATAASSEASKARSSSRAANQWWASSARWAAFDAPDAEGWASRARATSRWSRRRSPGSSSS